MRDPLLDVSYSTTSFDYEVKHLNTSVCVDINTDSSL